MLKLLLKEKKDLDRGIPFGYHIFRRPKRSYGEARSRNHTCGEAGMQFSSVKNSKGGREGTKLLETSLQGLTGGG